jgi:hypothetical protein
MKLRYFMIILVPLLSMIHQYILDSIFFNLSPTLKSIIYFLVFTTTGLLLLYVWNKATNNREDIPIPWVIGITTFLVLVLVLIIYSQYN